MCANHITVEDLKSILDEKLMLLRSDVADLRKKSKKQISFSSSQIVNMKKYSKHLLITRPNKKIPGFSSAPALRNGCCISIFLYLIKHLLLREEQKTCDFAGIVVY